MKIVRPALAAGERLLDRVLCVVGAILFSQAPEFMQQYLQRLGGHLDETRRILAQFRHTAAQSGLTLDQFIQKLHGNADPTVVRLGDTVADVVARTDSLAAAQAAIQNASIWARPFVFLHHVDGGIAYATWGIFRPAVPTTVEGLLYAALGMLGLLALYHGGVRYPIVRAARRRRERAGVGNARMDTPATADSRPGRITL